MIALVPTSAREEDVGDAGVDAQDTDQDYDRAVQPVPRTRPGKRGVRRLQVTRRVNVEPFRPTTTDSSRVRENDETRDDQHNAHSAEDEERRGEVGA